MRDSLKIQLITLIYLIAATLTCAFKFNIHGAFYIDNDGKSNQVKDKGGRQILSVQWRKADSSRKQTLCVCWFHQAAALSFG